MNKEKVSTLDPPRIISQSSLVTPITRDCDACSPVVFTKHEVPQSHLPDMSYYNDPALVKQTIDSKYYTALSPFTETFSVLNKSAMTCLQHFESPQTLKNIPSVWSET